MKTTSLLLATALSLLGHSHAAPTVSGDGACGVRALDNESFLTCEGERAPQPASTEGATDALPAAIPITSRQAVQMKADLGQRVLLADIRAFQPGGAMLARLDAALVATGLRHGDPVIVLARSDEHGRLAAELMREHGYEQVFVVGERDEGRLAAGR
ncbi:MAG: hypothetical protein KIS74_11175 [Burkholderiales bacterium]|nr:hypothetical protein [Burkholderiales bacterium]